MSAMSTARQRRYKERHPERVEASQRAYRATHPYHAPPPKTERQRASQRAYQASWHAQHGRECRLRRLYDLTLVEYDAILSTQGGGCAICGAAPKQNRRLAVDHDHDTGRVRGLLCDACNPGLGRFRDSPDLLRRAIAYIEREADPR